MAAQKGREFLLKMDIASTFTVMAGIKQLSFDLSDGHTDVSSADSVTDSSRWREMLAATGVKAMSISGSGVFKDSAVEAQFLTNKLSGAAVAFQLISPNFGTFEGNFVIGNYGQAGAYDGEVTYTLSLESAGEITFTAA